MFDLAIKRCDAKREPLFSIAADKVGWLIEHECGCRWQPWTIRLLEDETSAIEYPLTVWFRFCEAHPGHAAAYVHREDQPEWIDLGGGRGNPICRAEPGTAARFGLVLSPDPPPLECTEADINDVRNDPAGMSTARDLVCDAATSALEMRKALLGLLEHAEFAPGIAARLREIAAP